METIYEHADSSVCFVLVGNNMDNPDDRKISKTEARELAKSYNYEYFECSAKLNTGITDFFEALFTQIYNKQSPVWR
jgi:GTPase SAR1 family protein